MRVTVLCVLVLLSVLSAASAFAQSILVLGNSQHAYECFRRAEFAITSLAADDNDIALCDEALDQQTLSRRHRAATLVNRGILQVAAGKIADGRGSYDQALQLVDNQGEVYINIANVFMLQKDYREAVAQYTRGIPVMSRKQHVAYLNRGLAYEYLGDFKLAENDYQQALELAPEWVRARKMLARVRLKQGNGSH